MILPVTEKTIPKKEYMNRRDLTEVILPSHIEEIGAWAFAYCDRLSKIYIPDSVQTFGQDIFQGCSALKDIVVYEANNTDITSGKTGTTFFLLENTREKLSRLTAIAFTHFNQPALRCLRDVGSTKWLSMWEHTLLGFIKQPDDEGFDPFLAGGEEDYEDKNSNPDYFCHTRRMQKIQCILERLLLEQDYPLSQEIRTRLSDYLLSYSFWSLHDSTPAETIDVLLGETQRLSAMFKLYEALHLFEHIHIPDLISTLSPEQVELKALLLKQSRPCDFYL